MVLLTVYEMVHLMVLSMEAEWVMSTVYEMDHSMVLLTVYEMVHLMVLSMEAEWVMPTV